MTTQELATKQAAARQKWEEVRARIIMETAAIAAAAQSPDLEPHQMPDWWHSVNDLNKAARNSAW